MRGGESHQFSAGESSGANGLPSNISARSQERLGSFAAKVDDVLLEELWSREVGHERAQERVERFHNLFDKRLKLNSYSRVTDGVNHLLQELIRNSDETVIESAVGEVLTADYRQRRANEEAKKQQRIADTAGNKLTYASAYKINPRELAIEGAISDVATLLQAAMPVSVRSDSAPTGRDRLVTLPKSWINNWSEEIRKAA